MNRFPGTGDSFLESLRKKVYPIVRRADSRGLLAPASAARHAVPHRALQLALRDLRLLAPRPHRHQSRVGAAAAARRSARCDTQVVLLSGGEPLLNPQWHEIAAAAQEPGLQLWLLTSGPVAGEARARVRGAVRFDHRLAGRHHADTYAAIRGLDAFDKVCEGIRAAAARRRRRRACACTLQRANYRELPAFVALARELGAAQVSFLAVDVATRTRSPARRLCARARAAPERSADARAAASTRSSATHAAEFARGFIAESPAKLRRIHQYFAALLGLGAFPAVRCNAPEFSAVIDAEGRVRRASSFQGRAAGAAAAATSPPSSRERHGGATRDNPRRHGRMRKVRVLDVARSRRDGRR